METPRLERKLVAILAADIVAYSRHMERDEAAALARLTHHRLIVDDLIERHTGLIAGTAGDSVLAEFASVVDAVDCAAKIQQAQGCNNPILLRTTGSTSHTYMPTDKEIQQDADVWAFQAYNLGVTQAPASK